ncbi:MAG: hypothetical protein V3S18_04375 [Dehalococcoidia bacterium]
MAASIDPGAVIFVGENSFIRLSRDGGATTHERVSHWRALWTPAGPGHVLFYEGDLLGGTAVYSDNIALARWLQRSIQGLLYEPFGDASLPVREAAFERSGDARSYATELISGETEEIALTWTDLLPPFVMNAPAGPGPDDRPIGVYTTFFPAREARISVDGALADGEPFAEAREGRDSTSAVLAWCETWVRPAG